MSTKVLVFESDPAFAGELRNELGKLGCTTVVVDDGNVGLQQASANRPDLILLSIELPRMNGFSVCNKLKKDAALKDVPLIIMSSESSDETFEQHKKLRTRAEDYVHKPIAFGELLRHIQNFVAVGPVGQAESEAVIVIDDDIDIGTSDYVESEGTQIAARPAGMPALPSPVPPPPRAEGMDEDVDAFADAAFGRLTGAESPPAVEARPVHNGASEPTVVSPTSRRASVAPRASSVRPASGIDPAEHERVRAQLDTTRSRMAEVEVELRDARDEVAKMRLEIAETERLRRELDELKVKLASGPKASGISSREFLDLREALNKKDKEILGLREAQSKKDREIVEGQERLLALERLKADLDDKLLGVERELGEVKEKAEALSADKDLAKKANEDLRGRVEKARAEADARDKQLADLRVKQVEDRAAAEEELEGALADAQAKSEREKADALASQGAKLGQEHDAQLAALHRAHQQALDHARNEAAQIARDADAKVAQTTREADERHASALRDAEAKLAAAVSGLESRHLEAIREAEVRQAQAARDADGRHTDAMRELEARNAEVLDVLRKDGERRLAQTHSELEERAAVEIQGLRAEHTERITALENDRDARVAALESRAARELGEANDRAGRHEADLATTRQELSALREATDASEAANKAKVADLTSRLDDTSGARDALQARLGLATDRVTVLEAEVVDLRRTLAEVEAKLGAVSSRADRALAKWESDRQSLERAKDALAVALAQIEEAEGRAIG